MSVPFDPQQGLIIVRAELWGPTRAGALLATTMSAGKVTTGTSETGKSPIGFPA